MDINSLFQEVVTEMKNEGFDLSKKTNKVIPKEAELLETEESDLLVEDLENEVGVAFHENSTYTENDMWA